MDSDECLSTSESAEDQENQEQESSTSRKFSEVQTAKLNALYKSGMKGTGKRYSPFMNNAAAETGLTLEQVKVRRV